MCDNGEIEDTMEWDVGFTDGWNSCRKHSLEIMKGAMKELGVPQDNYPTPVSNAYKILNDGRKGIKIAK